MTNIKLYNKISQIGLDVFDNTKYNVSEDATAPEGILVRSAALHDEPFGKELLAIARAGAGVNNIPCDRCAEEGIVVFNTPGANANAVKELVIAGLMLSSRKVAAAIDWAKTLKGNGDQVGKMVEKGKGNFVGPEIMGKTLGVVGLGAIGVLVANAAEKLGMKVYGYDPYLSIKNAWNLSSTVKYCDDLAEICANCDYISLHIPCTKDTKGSINKDAFAQMKDGVRILNFARGELVNSDDMIEALGAGKVAAYVVDFPSDEMIGVENVTAIPHLGASTPESEDNCAYMAAHELIDYIENGNIVNSVNFPAVSMARNGDARVCVLHKNIPGIISAITTALAEQNINVHNMQNASRGDYAYSLLDVETVFDGIEDKLMAVDGIIRVRVIK
jgi:D-3-phosphoglycerate dehydrogenase